MRNWNLLRAGDWFPRFLPAFFYLWLERKRTRSEVTDTFWKSRKNPPVICMLIRVPLFTNSNCTSNSWGTNFGSEMDIHASLLQIFIRVSRLHFVKNQVTCLRPNAILCATERKVTFSPAPLRAKRKSYHSHLLKPSSRSKGVREWFLNAISWKLVNTPKLRLL